MDGEGARVFVAAITLTIGPTEQTKHTVAAECVIYTPARYGYYGAVCSGTSIAKKMCSERGASVTEIL